MVALPFISTGRQPHSSSCIDVTTSCWDSDNVDQAVALCSTLWSRYVQTICCLSLGLSWISGSLFVMWSHFLFSDAVIPSCAHTPMTHGRMESWSVNLVNVCCRPHQQDHPAWSSEKSLIGFLSAFNTLFWRHVWTPHFLGVGILGKTSGGLLGTSSTSVFFLLLSSVVANGSS